MKSVTQMILSCWLLTNIACAKMFIDSAASQQGNMREFSLGNLGRFQGEHPLPTALCQPFWNLNLQLNLMNATFSTSG